MSPLPAAVPAVPPANLAPVVAPTAATAAPHGWTTVVVRPGDTVADLATTYRTSPAALVARNHLPRGGHLIHPGQRLQVPRLHAAPTAATVAKPTTASTTTYRVRSGDTLGAIAAKHRTSLAALLKANRLSASAVIHPGQAIRVPAAAGTSRARTAAPAATTSTYTVRSGDTLSAIATRTRTPLAQLLTLNRLSASTVIHPGQRLRVPAHRATPARKPTSLSSLAANRAYLATAAVPSRAQTRAMIVAAAQRHGVDPALALAIGWQESGWNQRAVSGSNAIGVMQVIPLSGTWASELLGRKVDLFEAKDNIEAGVVILRALTRSTSSQDVAIASYYQGLHSVTTKGMYADTKAYVRSVKALRARM